MKSQSEISYFKFRIISLIINEYDLTMSQNMRLFNIFINCFTIAVICHEILKFLLKQVILKIKTRDIKWLHFYESCPL